VLIDVHFVDRYEKEMAAYNASKKAEASAEADDDNAADAMEE
jgi:hypothetical protein